MSTLELVEVEGSDERALIAPGFRLAFRWTGDRWSHAIGLGPGGPPATFAESVEADPVRDAQGGPTSPTYQDLHFHKEAGVHHALLVGQFGPHHYSAEFRVAPMDEAGGVELRVDIADRTRSGDGPLAATYRLEVPPWRLADASSVAARWDVETVGNIGLECPDGRLAVIEEGPSRSLAQVLTASTATEPTRRLIYRWQFPAPRRP